MTKIITQYNCCRLIELIAPAVLISSVFSGSQVGWIFTDLLSEDTRIGTVRYTRNGVSITLREHLFIRLICQFPLFNHCPFFHKDSYFLSAEECITAGYFQNLHSNPCRLSRDGHFGSKFVTVVATGRLFYSFIMKLKS